MSMTKRSQFSIEMEKLERRNREIIEEVELGTKAADIAARESCIMYREFINRMRFPEEEKYRTYDHDHMIDMEKHQALSHSA